MITVTGTPSRSLGGPVAVVGTVTDSQGVTHAGNSKHRGRNSAGEFARAVNCHTARI
jgi:hypothetical protein